MTESDAFDLPPWCAELARLDDETLTAWSSVGNLRRATRDVENGKVVLEEASGAIRVRVDDDVCTLADADLSHARCSCPAATACRHVLGAILWLRGQAALPTRHAAPVEGPTALQALCGLQAESILQKLTPSQRRKAVELAQDPSWVIRGDNTTSVGIELSRKAWECRWSPRDDIGGMVSNIPAAQVTIAHAAALLAVLRSRGLWQAPEVPAVEVEAVPSDLPVMLGHLLSRGISHTGDQVPSRLEVLATQVRSQGRKSLAAQMRTLGVLLERMGPSGVTTGDALHAVAVVLGSIESAHAPLVQEDSAPLEMDAICLGAHWWESSGGARGATVLFFELATCVLRTLPLARADRRDVRFTRETLWETQNVWKGTCLDGMQSKRLHLQKLTARADGSWKASESTSISSSPWPKSDDALWKSLGVSRWREVRELLAGLAGSAVVERTQVVLRPARLGVPYRLDSNQEVRWEVVDNSGQILILHGSPGDGNADRTGALSRFLHQHSDRVRGIAAVAKRSGMGIVLEPTSLLLDIDGEMVAWSPDFQPPPQIKASAISRWIRELKKKELTTVQLPVRSVVESRSALQALLDPLVELCERWAEAGSVGRPTSEEISRISKTLERNGFARLAVRVATLGATQDDLEAVRIHQLCRLLLELDQLG